MLNIIIGLIMFMFLVLVHEFGHFAVAKLSGIKVNEFSIGMGPVATKFTKGETQYSIRYLPLGGFVSMEGEDEASDDARSYSKAKASSRFMTILAGPLMNLFLAFMIFFAIYAISGAPSTTINEVFADSPAHEAGLREGDTIVSVNDKATPTFSYASKYLNESNGESIKLEIDRDGSISVMNITPVQEDGRYIIGFTPQPQKGIWFSVVQAFHQVIFIIVLLWETLVMMFTGILGFDQVGGPIAVIQQVGQASALGIESLMIFTAMISINLGFFNLLPIPALDGSKLLFIIIEKIIGRPLNQKFEQIITIAGFVFLMGLILLVSIKDVFSLFK